MVNLDRTDLLLVSSYIRGNPDLDQADPSPRRGYRYFERMEDGRLEDWTGKRSLAYLFLFLDGRLLTVTSWIEPDEFFVSVNCGMCDGTVMQSVPVESVTRTRISGATIITLKGNCNIFIPSPLTSDEVRICRATVQEVDPKDYKVRESSDGMQIWNV